MKKTLTLSMLIGLAAATTWYVAVAQESPNPGAAQPPRSFPSTTVTSNDMDATEVTLRDANIASSIVEECFPIDGFDLQYRGSIVFPTQNGIDNTGNGVWTVRYAIPDDHSYEVRFDILSVRRSADDVEIHVALTRVVYLHIRSCWRDDIGWVQPDMFDESGISIEELFMQCDEEALRYWRFQERLANGLGISD